MTTKRKAAGTPVPRGTATSLATPSALVADVRRLIADARGHVSSTANATLTQLYWHIGRRVGRDLLQGARADYGREIVATLSQQLTVEFGDGYSYSALTRMVMFAEVFPDSKIVATLSQQLGWSHFRELLPLKLPLQRDFYAEMCRLERWSVRTLRDKIAGMLYERTALSRKPEELARIELAALRDEDKLSTDLVLRDPYLLDFLGLKASHGPGGPRRSRRNGLALQGERQRRDDRKSNGASPQR